MNMLELREKNGQIIGTISETDRLNATVAQEIKTELTSILSKKGTKMVLNLSNIKFIDSTGIGTLISALKTARENNGAFQLCAIQNDVMGLITLMKLDKIFDIFKSEEECK